MRKPVLLLLVFSVVMGVSAQGKNATVTTTVTDPNKAVLRGASVTLTNVETKSIQKCVSNERGECKFEVPAGAYELTTDLDRFCPLKISDIRLKESETVPVELKLDPVRFREEPEYEKLIKSLGR
jgi:hypothetical protein